MKLRTIATLGLALLGACGGGGTDPDPPVPASCAAPAGMSLAVGAHQVIDPRLSGGCVRLGGAAGDEEYLVVLFSGSGVETKTGVAGPYTLQFGNQGSVSVAPGGRGGTGDVWVAPLDEPAPAAASFDAELRRREAALAVAAPAPPPSAPLAPAPAPPVGDKRTFQVCATSSCSTTNTVNATARAVGQSVAIYADDANPQFADTLRVEDYTELMDVFDRHLYPIGTSAFGVPSDIDNNGVVLILITKRVNDFTTNCVDGRVIGYFYGGDLLTTFSGSNKAEVFFTYSPAPAAGNCSAISRRTALNQLKPTLIHEFQHMISFNQHRLVRSGNQEETWLNEGLSHLAEDLAGQLIPNADCPGFNSCRSLFASGNVSNAFSYWQDPTRFALVFGESSNGTLQERGAGVLFTRWLLDQFGTGQDGLGFTRALVGTNRIGQANLEAVTGQGFPLLAGQWLMASYADDLPGFTDPSGKLSYDTWDFRTVMNNPANSGLFPGGYPLRPEIIVATASRTGELKGGSGRYFLLRPGGTAKDLLLSGGSGSVNQPDQALLARLAVLRIK